MSFEQLGLDIMTEINKRAVNDFVQLDKSWRRRYFWVRFTYFYHIIVTLVWSFLSWFFRLFLVAEAKHHAALRFFRRYLHFYLASRFITIIPNLVFKTAYEGPKLLLAVRSFPMAPYILAQEMDQPLIIPRLPSFQRFWPYGLPPDPIFNCASHFSYSDANLKENFPNIVTLLEAGYPVFVYINDLIANPNFVRDVYFHPILKEILGWDLPTYFLEYRGLDMMNYASWLMPCNVKINSIEKSKLLSNQYADNWDQTAGRMATFMGFNNGIWLSDSTNLQQ